VTRAASAADEPPVARCCGRPASASYAIVPHESSRHTLGQPSKPSSIPATPPNPPSVSAPQAGEAATLTTGERLAGMALLLAAGAFFYRAWGMGEGVAGGCISRQAAAAGRTHGRPAGLAPGRRLPWLPASCCWLPALSAFAAAPARPATITPACASPCPCPPLPTAPGGAGLLGSGPLLPGLQAAGLERYLSLVVLLACLARVIVIPRP
jgi:hypothetical protein